MERLLRTHLTFRMQVLRVHLGSCGASSCYDTPSWCLVSGRQPKRAAVVWCLGDNRNGLLLLTRQSVVGACRQPTGSQLLTVRQLRWVVLDAPEQRWLEAKRLLGLVVVLNAPEQRWLEAKRLLGSNAGSA